MCVVKRGGLSLEGIDVAKEAVIQGRVAGADGSPVAGAYVRLLDASGEFTAEVQTADDGGFRFFAAPGEWTVRALASGGAGQSTVTAERGGAADVEIRL